MGILVDFQEAKDRLTAPIVEHNEPLEDAVETFAFSRRPKIERVAIVLAGIFGGEPETYLKQADELAVYAAQDFMAPYKANSNGL